jgi:hypothetical protein
MATIKARRYANGAIRYTAIVRKRVDKKIVHREARTFTHRSAAGMVRTPAPPWRRVI